MELLSARHLGIELQGRVLLADAQLTLLEGMRVGLTGANGSGKSMLLEVLAGIRTASGGSLHRAPGVEVGYLAQRPRGGELEETVWQAASRGLARTRELERQMRAEEELLSGNAGDLDRYARLNELFERAGGYSAEARLRESLLSLGLDEAMWELRVGELSGGEAARLALARTLASQPELLLLDEPGNALDLPTLRWLGRRLSSWRGALVLVSHDRALLDETTTHTAHLTGGRLQLYRGNYTRFREQLGVARRRGERQRRERRKEQERLERTALQLRSWGNAAAQRRRKRLNRRLEELARAEAEEVGEVAGHGRGSAPGAGEVRAARGNLLEASGLSRRLGDAQLFTGLRLELAAGEKVALLGANGSGKTTLLRILAGEEWSDDPRAQLRWNRDVKLLYADQEGRGLADGLPVDEQLRRTVSSERANMLLSLTGLPHSRRAALPEQLSGGERARAGLARLLADNGNLWLLDEPSNDLDLAAVETLHDLLESTEAAFVLATHDRALAAAATRVWSLEEGQLVEYRGGIEGYLAGRRRLEPGADRHETAAPIESATPARQVASESGSADESAGPHGRQVSRQGAEGGEAPNSRGELERLELELIGLEERLADPLALAERERGRLEVRLVQVLDELSLHYDAALPSPAPALTVHEEGLAIWANRVEGELELGSDAPCRLSVRFHEGVAHLTLRDGGDLCTSPWARSAILDGAVRLVFYLSAPRAIQHYSQLPLSPAPRLLRWAGDGWWSLPLGEFERAEGWPHTTGSTGSTGDTGSTGGGASRSAGRSGGARRAARRRRGRRRRSARESTEGGGS